MKKQDQQNDNNKSFVIFLFTAIIPYITGMILGYIFFYLLLE